MPSVDAYVRGLTPRPHIHSVRQTCATAAIPQILEWSRFDGAAASKTSRPPSIVTNAGGERLNATGTIRVVIVFPSE